MEHGCKICGYEWEGIDKPKACPRCKRYDWLENVKLMKRLKRGAT